MRFSWAVALLLSVASLAWAQDPNPGLLFSSVGAGPVAAMEVPPTVLRQRFVGIDLDGLGRARQQLGTVAARAPLRLNLFDDAVFQVVITDTGPTSGGYWLSGHLASKEMASVTLVVNGEVVAGTVRAPGATYAIRWVGNGVHLIRQLDPAAIPRLGGDAVMPPALPRPAPAPVEHPAAGTVIAAVERHAPSRGWLAHRHSGRLHPKGEGRPRRPARHLGVD